MGTWGEGIFEDDLALDIRAAFDELLEQGIPITQVITPLIRKYREAVGDDDEGPVVWLTLAAVLLDRGSMDEHVRAKAIEVIDSEAGLRRWAEAGADELATRKAVLAQLRANLISV
jgi:hypothetical protein